MIIGRVFREAETSELRSFEVSNLMSWYWNWKSFS
jgi:hypothetical protein